jgi:hypothetical protein
MSPAHPLHRAVHQTLTMQAMSVVRQTQCHAAHHVCRTLRHTAHHAATKLLLSLTRRDRVAAHRIREQRTGRPTVDAGSVD